MEREQQDWIVRSARRNVSLTGAATRADGNSMRILVSDLSYQGCKIYSQNLLDVGEVLKVTVPGFGAINAQVRWTADEKAGLSFLLGKSIQEERRARLGV
jgi:PilZ domain